VESGHQTKKGKLHEQKELKAITKQGKTEPTAHRDGLTTVRVATVAMVSTAKKKAVFRSLGQREALRMD
jgi:hypothetical protein